MANEIEKYKEGLKKAVKKISELDQQLKEEKSKEDIAIIGYNCRFPEGANNSEEFWHLLKEGYDAVTEIKKDRFDIDAYYSEQKDDVGKTYTKYASFLNTDIRDFDNIHFELSPKEATSMDPQHRLLLEVSWEAIENAGLDVTSLKGSNTGVFIGLDSIDYVKNEVISADKSDITPYSLMGISTHSAAGRMSYFYDFKGPAIVCNTACSSSLVALNMAIESLRNGQCDLAIVGGINLIINPEGFIGLSRLQGLSADGKCKTFDDAADGFGRGEGCGIVLLKRLADANKDGNTVEALVKGICVGQDGKANGFYAPNGLGEERVIKAALKNSKLSVDDIDYVEAHGTGTSLGDFIEAQAICNAYKNKKEPLLIGSVKSNIGHLEAASGMASLIKVLLSIKHKQLPPSIHVHKLNQNIDWRKLKVVQQLTEWKKDSGRRRAGIDAFGISGTLVHVVVEEADQVEEDVTLKELPQSLLTLTTKSQKALLQSAKDMKGYMEQTDEKLSDIAYSSNLTRSNLEHKLALVGSTKDELIKKLDEVIKDPERLAFSSSNNKTSKKKIAFLFTGQGSIYKNIAKELYAYSKTFKKALDLCNDMFNEHIEMQMMDIILSEDEHTLFRPLFSQPIIFSIEYALMKFWQSLGIEPTVVIGHSIGEYAAACCAGILSLKDAVKMIAERGRLMESVDIDGKMVGILTNEEKVKHAIEESGCQNVSIAAINAPNNVTLSGKSEEVDQVIKILQQTERVFINKLNILHPYHSLLMQQYEAQYEERLSDITFSKENIKIIPCLTGKIAQAEMMSDKKYWVKHLSSTVRFKDAMEEAQKLGVEMFIEIGGDATLTGLASQCIAGETNKFLPSLRNGLEDYKQLLGTLSTLFLSGVKIDFNKFYKEYRKKKVTLPNYPFQRKRLWGEKRTFVSKRYKKQQNAIEKVEEMVEYSESEKLDKLQIQDDLKKIINMVTGLEIDEIESDKNLFSLGFDSLVIMTFNKQVSNKYHVEISLNTFFTSLDTLEKIAEYLYENSDYKVSNAKESTREEVVVPQEGISSTLETAESEIAATYDSTERYVEVSSSPNTNIGLIKSLFDSQFKIMAEQNEIIKNMTNSQGGNAVTKTKALGKHQDIRKGNLQVVKKQESKAPAAYVPYKKLNLTETSKMNDLQLKYIKSIEKKYTSLTKGSKKNIQDYRGVYANNRNVAGFRPLLKEMLYQIVAESGKGSKLYDLDGNEFIDLTMGFGVNLFGHNPDFINKALKDELEHGMPLGPMGRLAGAVAQDISDLTGAERVAFYNSGTEANMVAVRLARAITGKKKIVVFSGSYHGTYDGLLGLASYGMDGTLSTIPLAPGIGENAVKDLVLLNYNTKDALNYIAENSDQIAGVLVESVQSRRPDVQPKEFLQKLRKVTEERDIALIFDEIITGFRIGAGGAQEYFGIKADIATYGKVAGGGMPVGIVTGKAKYMDSIDGGMWYFGDDSVPTCNEKRTFVAGTFSHHPMAMAASHAVLSYIKKNKEELYTKLNEKTKYLVDKLNEFFREQNVPINVVNFGSLFRFVFRGDFEIFFYGMLEKGIYIWEGRNCFISTAHTDEDIEKIIEAVKLTIQEMREAGYFSDSFDPDPTKATSSKKKIDKSNIVSKEEAVIPMSLIQQRLYSQMLISNSDPFDIISAYIIKNEINVKKLEDVINKIIARHEVLRSSMYLEEGEFKQKVVNDWEFKIKEIIQTETESINDLISNSIKKFDVSKPPLIEVLLIKTNENEKLLVFHFHHMASDGMSMDIFVREINILYAANKIEPLEKQYSDFVKWEQQYLESGKMREDKEYWTDSLASVPSSVALPFDFPKDSNSGYLGNRIIEYIDTQTTTTLKDIAKHHSTSLFMMLLAIVDILIHKISGENEIAITTPVSNRFDGGFEECIGMFTNTIALSSKISENVTFEKMLDEVRSNALKAYGHLNYPYNFIINELKSAGESQFNVMFVYENVGLRSVDTSELQLEEVDYIPETEEYDLTFELLEQDGKIKVLLEYRADLFQTKSMERMMERFKYIIKQVIENSQVKYKDIETIIPSEKSKVLGEFNNTYKAYQKDKTVIDLFEEQVQKTPENIAVTFKDRKITYRELNRRTNAIGMKLRGLGIKPNDFVVIMAERSIELIEAIYGILKAGGAYVSIDASYPEERIRYIINDLQPKAILTLGEEVPEWICLPNINLLEEIEYKEEENLKKVNQINDLAYVIYTSGTTGQPKGVMIEHKGLHNLVLSYKHIYSMTEKDVVLQFANTSFDQSVWDIFSIVISGNTLCMLPEEYVRDTEKLEEYMNEQGITVASFTPVLINELKPQNLPKLRLLDSSGEAGNLEVLKTWCEGRTVVNTYGPTEITVNATSSYVEKSTKKLSIGKPIFNTQIYIVNGNKLCGIGVPGELCIAGDGVARGYLHRPELTEKSFVDNIFGTGKMYRSGDLARWLDDGNIECMGRIDEQVKIRGFRIELGEIENAIRKIRDIEDVAVIVRKDSKGEKGIYAYLVASQLISTNEIREILSKTLPNYMIPAYMLQIEKIPFTQNGKLDKRKLPDIEIDSEQEYIAPENELEKMLCIVLKEVLGSKKVGMSDNFLALGGDSIKAIRVISKIRDMGYEISVKDIMNNVNVKRMSMNLVPLCINQYNQGEVVGTVGNTPILEMFKQYQLVKPHHYNQNTMVAIETDNEDILKESLNALVKHHDILRAVYSDGELKILSYKESKKYDFKIFDFTEESNDQSKMMDECIKLQSSIDLENGPLMKVGFFKTKTVNYLLLCIHHLVVDGVSWRILIEDLFNAIGQVADKQEAVTLPAKTASYIEWVEALKEYKGSKILKSEQEYWKKISEQIRCSKLQIEDQCMETGYGRESIAFTIPETEEIIHKAGKAFTTEINDLFISALGMTVKQFTGQSKLAISLEGHGREEIYKKIDISRTVGWFTSIYPIIVECHDDIQKEIISTKEMLRKVPNNGIGYGVLRKDAGDDMPNVCFNYLGDLDENDKLETITQELIGKDCAEENVFPESVIIDSMVLGNQLSFIFTYNRSIYKKSTIEGFMKLYKQCLNKISEFCCSQKETTKTISDVSLEELAENDFLDIMNEFN